MSDARTVLVELLEGPYDGVETLAAVEAVYICPRCGEVHDVRVSMPAPVVRLGPESIPVACLPRRAPVPGDRVADYRFYDEGYRSVTFRFAGYSIVNAQEYEEGHR